MAFYHTSGSDSRDLNAGRQYDNKMGHVGRLTSPLRQHSALMSPPLAQNGAIQIQHSTLPPRQELLGRSAPPAGHIPPRYTQPQPQPRHLEDVIPHKPHQESPPRSVPREPHSEAESLVLYSTQVSLPPQPVQRRTPGLRASAVVGALVISVAAKVRVEGGVRSDLYEELSLASFPAERRAEPETKPIGWVAGIWQAVFGTREKVVTAPIEPPRSHPEEEIKDLRRQIDLLYSEMERHGTETSDIKGVLTDYGEVMQTVVQRGAAATHSKKIPERRQPSGSPEIVFRDCIDESPIRSRTVTIEPSLVPSVKGPFGPAFLPTQPIVSDVLLQELERKDRDVVVLHHELLEARSRAEAAEGASIAATQCAVAALAEAAAARDPHNVYASGVHHAPLPPPRYPPTTPPVAVRTPSPEPSPQRVVRHAAGSAAATRLLSSRAIPIVQWRSDGSVTKDDCGHLATPHCYLLIFREGEHTELFVWHGRMASDALRQLAMDKANEVETFSGGCVVWHLCEEGCEPTRLMTMLVSCGRRLVVRTSEATVFLLKVLKVDDTYVKIVETERSTTHMTSENVLMLCQPNAVSVWQGATSCVWKRSAAVQEATCIAPKVLTVEEGRESNDFLSWLTEPTEGQSFHEARLPLWGHVPPVFFKCAPGAEDWLEFSTGDIPTAGMDTTAIIAIVASRANYVILPETVGATEAIDAAAHLFRQLTPVTVLRHSQTAFKDSVLNSL